MTRSSLLRPRRAKVCLLVLALLVLAVLARPFTQSVTVWDILWRLHKKDRASSIAIFYTLVRVNLEGGPRESDPRWFSTDDVIIGDADAQRRVRRYLFGRTIWPSSHDLRLVAAGVLVGKEAESEAMLVLADSFRKIGSNGRSLALQEAEVAARTERALPLWRGMLDNEDSNLRRWTVRNLGAIGSQHALSLLTTALEDKDYAVRKEAALILMARDSREALPVLTEVLAKEHPSTVEDALPLLPVFRTLSTWGVERLPWEKLEAFMTADAKHLPYKGSVLHLAGQCILAGRDNVAKPFLEDMYAYGWRDKYTRMQASHMLAAGESIGIRPLVMWVEDCGDLAALKSLVDFTSHRRCNLREREIILPSARRAFDRCLDMPSAHRDVYRLLALLGEMGAIYRVIQQDGELIAHQLIPIPYDQVAVVGPGGRRRWAQAQEYPKRGYGGAGVLIYHGDLIVSIYGASVRSAAVSAAQEGIRIPEEWLSSFKAEQMRMIESARDSGSEYLLKTARYAIRIIGDGYLPEDRKGAGIYSKRD